MGIGRKTVYEIDPKDRGTAVQSPKIIDPMRAIKYNTKCPKLYCGYGMLRHR